MSKNFVLNRQEFLGIDERAGCSTDIKSMPRLVNFKIDEAGRLKKREGCKLFAKVSDGKPVTMLWSGSVNERSCLYAACQTTVYYYNAVKSSFIALGDTSAQVTDIFCYRDKVYVLGGNIYEVNSKTIAPVTGYVPLVATSCAANGSGTALESPNMLTSSRRVRYNGDGSSVDYVLPEQGLASVDSVTVDGEACTIKYTAHLSLGIIEFAEPFPVGINNIEIQYSMPYDKTSESMIRRCKKCVTFEDRLFLYGNNDCGEYLFHSDLADGIPSATYFGEASYHVFDSTVTALCTCYNRLLVFFERAAKFMYSELKTDLLGNVYTSFPVYQLNDSKGHIIRGNCVSLNNTPITLSADGLNRWVSTVISDERSAKEFSERVHKILRTMLETKADILIINRAAYGEIWICNTYCALIYNSVSDCFYYYDIKNISSAAEYDRGVLVGKTDGSVYLFSDEYNTDNGDAISAEFETPYCTFGTPYALKSLSKISLTTEGTDSFEAELTLKRGNGRESQELTKRLKFTDADSDGSYRITERVNMKRFYSCKLKLKTDAENVAVSGISLFGRLSDNALRKN